MITALFMSGFAAFFTTSDFTISLSGEIPYLVVRRSNTYFPRASLRYWFLFALPVLPSAERQRDVMSLIYDNIKANLPADMARFDAVRQELKANGAQAVVLGCTELSLIKRDYPIGHGFIDAMEVLARAAVCRCGGTLKAEYRCLIT